MITPVFDPDDSRMTLGRGSTPGPLDDARCPIVPRRDVDVSSRDSLPLIDSDDGGAPAANRKVGPPTSGPCHDMIAESRRR